MGAVTETLRRVMPAVRNWLGLLWLAEFAAAVLSLAAHPTASDLSAIAQAGGSLLTVTACLRLRRRTPAHYRASSNFMLGGISLWNAADVSWLVLHGTSVAAHWSVVTNATYLLGSALMVVSAIFVAGLYLQSSSVRAVTDGFLVGLVIAFVTWASSGDLAGATVVDKIWALSTVSVDAMLVTVWVVVLMSSRIVNPRTAGLLILDSALLLVADSVYVHSELTGSFVGTSWLGWAWAAVSTLRAIAFFSIAYDRARRSRPAPLWWQRIVPTVAILAAMIFMSVTLPFEDHFLPGALTVAIVVTLVVRQVLVEVEYARLGAEVAAASEQLVRRAERDQLTGLYLRDALFRRAQAAVDRSRDPGSELALIFVDIDGFKIVNDRFGHAVGDQMLTALARRLELSACDEDTVARVGGDEFVLLRVGTGATGEDTADEWADGVRRSLSEPVLVGDVPMRVTASVGLVVSNRPGTTVDELLSHADQAAYRAKIGGRNQTARFDLPHSSESPTLHHVSSAVAALGKGELEAWYQPIVDLRTSEVIGAEALVRWIHPDGRVRNAGEFVLDLIVAGRGAELTDIILTQACRDFAHGVAAERGWTVSVNLSAAELGDPGVVDLIERAIKTSGIDPRRVQIEIDERTSPTGPISRVLEAIDRLGVSLAVDDFGASNSTFGQLARLAPSTLKLDRSLVDLDGHDDLPVRRFHHPHEMDDVLRSPDLIQAFTQLAHHVSMKVVVEGVETVAQLEALIRLGCDQGQGYLWSKALPAQSFFALAHSGRILADVAS